MSERLDHAAMPPDRAMPTRVGNLVFEAKAALLRLKRTAADLFADGPRRRQRGTDLSEAPVVAKSRSPLWTATGGPKDRLLNAGKVQNLRVAIRGFDGVEVAAGEVLSFWRQVGRPVRRRGYVAGRELREGCMIATVGGGLCQLSNALYEVALDAGLDVVERHAHTRVVPGSRAEAGHDATVFWNYIDLRVRADRPFRIEARLTADALELTIRSKSAAPPRRLPSRAAAARAHDCLSCGQIACHRHDPDSGSARVPAAWLVDAPRPEFTRLFRQQAGDGDLLMLPSRRIGRHAGGWPRIAAERTADLAVLRRSFSLRTAAADRPRAAILLAADERLARHYASRLPAAHTRLVVAQSLLPHLWRIGALQGRSFDVLLDRLPLEALQATLDAAAARHPDSPTLRDFRAPPAIVTAEREALDAARRLISPHRAIVASLPAGRVTPIDWVAPPPLPVQRGGRTFLFAGPLLARKGSGAMREAMTGIDIDLLVERRGMDRPEQWNGLPVRFATDGDMPAALAGVVSPALVEHHPYTVLRALAAGLPAIATPACGLPAQPGLTIVPADDPAALRAALLALL